MPRIREVRKRDNRIVPFDQSKIADAIYKAVRSVGGGDRALAADLAAAVTLFLEKKFTGGIPSIEDIQDMVETVLQETGHHDVAAAYIEYRKKRSKIREVLQVHKERTGGPTVEAVSLEAAVPWRKAKIVAALIKEADLEVPVAEEIAAAVEEKVFRSGIRRISTSLIRELVDNELFERGYAAKLKRQAPIGFPKYNLEQVIFSVDAKEPYSFAKDPEETEFVVAHHVLRQYALEEIFSSEVGEASRDQRIVLHGLGEPLRLYRINLPRNPEFISARGVTTKLLRLIRASSRETTIPFPREEKHLRELGILAYRRKPVAVRIKEDVPLPEPPDPEDPRSVLRYRVFLDPGASVPVRLIESAARYYMQGLPVEFVVFRNRPATLVPARVTLNLPQLAIRSGRTRLGDLYGELDHALSLAIKALFERRSFLLRASRSSDLPLWEILSSENGLFGLERAEFEIGIFGLADAAKFVTGREVFQDDESFALSVRIARHLASKSAREARGFGIKLRLVETLCLSVVRTCFRHDRHHFPEMREILKGRSGKVSYTPGVRIPAQAPLDPLTRNEYLAELFPFVELEGIVEEDSELRSGGEDLLVSLLEESVPLFARRTAEASEAEANGPDRRFDTDTVGSVEEK